MRDKRKFTAELYKHFEGFSDMTTAKDLYQIIWENTRNEGGFRLTTKGYDLLSNYLELENHKVKLDAIDFWESKILLMLDQKLKHPYYIDNISFTVKPTVVTMMFFDSKEAMLAILYGNIQKFLDNYS
jgi:hypothetical protein